MPCALRVPVMRVPTMLMSRVWQRSRPIREKVAPLKYSRAPSAHSTSTNGCAKTICASSNGSTNSAPRMQ
jgi:hypothetical protein